MSRPRKYPPELLDRGARLVMESGRPIACRPRSRCPVGDLAQVGPPARSGSRPRRSARVSGHPDIRFA